MEWDAVESVPTEKVAEVPLKVPVPKVVAPSLKVTVPVGVPLPGAGALTVAVKVTGWPDTEGLTEEATVVVVLAAFTVWLKGEPVLSLPVKRSEERRVGKECR